MIAASGTRFDGLDLLLVLLLLGLLFGAIWWLVTHTVVKNDEEFELVKRREMLNGIDLTPTKHVVFADPALDRVAYPVSPEEFITTPIGFFPEDDLYEVIKPFDWRDHPIVFDWMLDDPACL